MKLPDDMFEPSGDGRSVFLASGYVGPFTPRRKPSLRERFFTWLGDRAQDFAQWCYGRAM